MRRTPGEQIEVFDVQLAIYRELAVVTREVIHSCSPKVGHHWNGIWNEDGNRGSIIHAEGVGCCESAPAGLVQAVGV